MSNISAYVVKSIVRSAIFSSFNSNNSSEVRHLRTERHGVEMRQPQRRYILYLFDVC